MIFAATTGGLKVFGRKKDIAGMTEVKFWVFFATVAVKVIAFVFVSFHVLCPSDGQIFNHSSKGYL